MEQFQADVEGTGLEHMDHGYMERWVLDRKVVARMVRVDMVQRHMVLEDWHQGKVGRAVHSHQDLDFVDVVGMGTDQGCCLGLEGRVSWCF